MRRVEKSELADPIFDKYLATKCTIATFLIMFLALSKYTYLPVVITESFGLTKNTSAAVAA